VQDWGFEVLELFLRVRRRMTFITKRPPVDLLAELRQGTPAYLLELVDYVWWKKDLFIKWPERSFLFMPGSVRINYHEYGAAQKARLKAAGIKPDSRSNGPAIMAYLLAGGHRPGRAKPNKQWSIHHIYDGHFPAKGKSVSTRAVNDGRYFTEAAGLVAIHPIADALADEVPYFAWLLRFEAYQRYDFDPDDVFR